MKERKYRWEMFNLYDYQGVERHLNAMAARGWRLESAGNWLWKYRRAEPAPVRYAVTYSWEASQFNPRPTEGQQNLEELCAAAGWKKAAEWHQMEMFFAETAEAVPLETDEALRLEGLHRAMKRNFLPGHWGLLALSLFLTAGNLYGMVRTPLKFFSSGGRMFGALMYGLLLLFVGMDLWSYLGWRRRSLRSIAQGGGCAVLGEGYRKAAAAGLVLVAVLTGVYFLLEWGQRGRGYVGFFLAYLALMGLLIAAVHGTKNVLRKWGVSRRKNMAATLAVDVVLAVALVGGVTWGALHLRRFAPERESYVYEGREWDVHPEELPLTLEELTGAAYDHVRRSVLPMGSFLLEDTMYWDRAMKEGEQSSMQYEIWEPKTKWLYRLLVEDLTAPVQGEGWERSFQPADPAPWGAEAAYRRHLDGRPTDTWLLCWPGRVVSLTLEGEPDAAEMAAAGRALAG